jgi:hypothetical protein
MMSPGTIRAMSDDAARKAAKAKKRPYVPFNEEEIENYPPFPFPFIGTYEPEGWRKVEELFCDSSGFGAEWEPALTIGQLIEKMKGWEREGKSYGYAVTEAGQFQIRLGVFEQVQAEKRPRKSRCRSCKASSTAG